MTDTQRIDALIVVVDAYRERIEALEKEVDRLRQQQSGVERRHDAWLALMETAAKDLERRVATMEQAHTPL